MAAAVRSRGGAVQVRGERLVLEGISAREAGEIVEAAGAGPVHHLSERTSSFEDAYLELAGTLTRRSSTANDQKDLT
jgi:hypothetical protein